MTQEMNKKRPTDSLPPSPKKLKTITADEVKLYDRQIRLWGLESQTRMRNARILMVGMSALTNEVLKNVVLAGVAQVTLFSDQVVEEKDFGCQFFLREGDLGKMNAECILERVQLLNPLVELKAVAKPISDIDADFLNQYDTCCLFNGNPSEISNLDNLCRQSNVKFYAGGNLGFQSYLFCDLLNHKYSFTRKKHGADGDVSIVEEREVAYPSFDSCMGKTFDPTTRKKRWLKSVDPLYFALMVLFQYHKDHGKFPVLPKDKNSLLETKEAYLKSALLEPTVIEEDFLLQLVTNREAEFSPSCAVVGGFWAQEIFKALTQKEVAFNNFFCHDVWKAKGILDS